MKCLDSSSKWARLLRTPSWKTPLTKTTSPLSNKKPWMRLEETDWTSTSTCSRTFTGTSANFTSTWTTCTTYVSSNSPSANTTNPTCKPSAMLSGCTNKKLRPQNSNQPNTSPTRMFSPTNSNLSRPSTDSNHSLSTNTSVNSTNLRETSRLWWKTAED